ncbi:cuticle protein 8-like [Amphibalanus amphitrite]|uniref:cuticle protein 8-like n=1 Tax=Amphibalanus amphitrite TaxID=1232801 RepID=UPI001C900D69|nr:cuticle protein 8-like [Amphibalanus amphitrite]
MWRRWLLSVLICGILHLVQTRGGSAQLQVDGRLPNYAFSWGSIDGAGNGYGQSEHREGDVIRGSYRVTLPNGKTQVVEYSVDDRSGYVADVRYVDGTVDTTGTPARTVPAGRGSAISSASAVSVR